MHILGPTESPSPIHGFRRGALSLTPGALEQAHTFSPYIGNGPPTFDSKLGNPYNGYLNLLFVERVTV